MDDSLAALAARQQGVLTRAQCHAAGVSDGAIRHRVQRGWWVRWHPGVYIRAGGAPTYLQRIWAALLALGLDRAAACGPTALWLADPEQPEPVLVHVAVEDDRPQRSPGRRVRVHTLPSLADGRVHPALQPPRLRPEHAAVDVAHAAGTARTALEPLDRLLARRLTTPARLREALAARKRHRWRRLLEDALDDAVTGALGGLERADARVRRQHGLPPGHRQRKAAGPTGRRWIDVVTSAGLQRAVVVELDGRLGHERLGDAFRDMDRDNLDQEAGRAHLRYGAADLADRPCEFARQLAVVLRAAGWCGEPVRCGAGCTAAEGPRHDLGLPA